jgi:hypothetical protein
LNKKLHPQWLASEIFSHFGNSFCKLEYNFNYFSQPPIEEIDISWDYQNPRGPQMAKVVDNAKKIR